MRALFSLTVATALFVGAPARADTESPEPPLIVTWIGPEECDRSERVLEDATRLAGESGKHAPPVEAKVVVTRTPRGFSIRLETKQLGQSGVREFESESCDKLSDATALILSLMLAPVETTETVAPEGIATVVREKVEGRRAARRGRVSDRDRMRWSFGSRVGADIGTLPQPTLFLGPAGSVAVRRWRGELYGAIYVPRETTEGPRPDAGAIVGLYAAGARGCLTIIPAALALDACAGMEAGRAVGEGQGIREPRDARVLWLGAIFGLKIRSADSKLPAAIGLDAAFALSRPAFTIDGFGEVFRSSIVAGRLTFGVEFEP